MITDSTAENQQKSAEAGLNRRPLNLQSNALPLSYRRTNRYGVIYLKKDCFLAIQLSYYCLIHTFGNFH